MSRFLLGIGFLSVIAAIVAHFIATMAPTGIYPPILQNKRIALVIAHPDDEAMFFSPSLLALTRPEAGNHVKILCLSSGDAEGLGKVRRNELVKSGLMLGLKSVEDISLIDNPVDFPDSMTTKWDTEKIVKVLQERFGPSRDELLQVDVIITFDAEGISSHPNHISLYHGARAFISSLADGQRQAAAAQLYTLTTVNVFRKYSGILDTLATSSLLAAPRLFSDQSGDGGGKEITGSNLVYMHGFRKWLTAREAMTRAHVSQMRWFRYGWITLSRYMFVNELKLERF